jgi:ubiquinone/menaquinone biosynthesis C-methylase UbiE
LDPKAGDHILDAACGTGNFAIYLASIGAKVVAFDYSDKMIEYAKSKIKNISDNIEFHLTDATKYDELMLLKSVEPFNKAVSNMAIMDIVDIEPLFKAIHEMLSKDGIFVFSCVHPCFQTPNMKKFVEINDYSGENSTKMGIHTYEYINPCVHQVNILANNNKKAIHYHRPLSMICKLCFENGFFIDGLEEPVFEKHDNDNSFDWYEIPPSLIVRLRKR